MALRIVRQLFRLWLVLSLLWVGAIGTVTWQSQPVEWPGTEVVPHRAKIEPKRETEVIPDWSNVVPLPKLGELSDPEVGFKPPDKDTKKWEATLLSTSNNALPSSLASSWRSFHLYWF